ncbi:hypothetical protein ABW21_db0205402 [Orbilia brochopaga]|nr:hypothetical protein ABW21_db0205402 [Drechslerella brochopaga]
MFKSAARPASSLAAQCAKARGVKNATFNTSAPLQAAKRVDRPRTVIELSNGVEVPALAFQSNVFGDSAPKTWKPRFNQGWRHLDVTASFNNKSYLERQLWDLADVTRDELFIATKLESFMHHDPYTSLLHHMRGLRTGHIDLWYLKYPVSWRSAADKYAPLNKDGVEITWLDAWKVMEKLYEDGKVKALGVCNLSKAELEKLLRHAKYAPQVHQMELTPYLQQKDFVKFNQEHGIKICSQLPYAVMDQGESLPLVKDLLEEPILKEVGEIYNLSPAQIIAAWVISSGHIASISNIGTDEHKYSWANIRCDIQLEPEHIEMINTLDCARRAMYPKSLGYTPMADLEGVDTERVYPTADIIDKELAKKLKKAKEEEAEDPNEIKYGTIMYTGKVMPWVRSIDDAKLTKNARRRALAIDQTLPGDPHNRLLEGEDLGTELNWAAQHETDETPEVVRNWLRQNAEPKNERRSWGRSR